MNNGHNVGAVARKFQVEGEFVSAAPYGSGHINDSYCAVFDRGGQPVRVILQRINHHVFKNPVAVMENIQRVTSHLAPQVACEADGDRRVLRLIEARDGGAWYVDEEGSHWRAYWFIERAQSFDAVEGTQQAYQAARAFGEFQRMLADLPAPRLHDTIPNFHHTPKRFRALEEAITADVAGRAILAKREIEFALARKSIVSVLLDANLPERVTHNDTKFNNVLLDDETGEGICVIDLDTVMPGLVAYDFGDMVRTTTSPAKEDEQDLSKVDMHFSLFESLVRGYLSSAGGFLSKAEKDQLAFSGKLITFEIGIRFLTDYLAGDTYFKVHRDGHNLHRCRTQFKLVESIEEQEERMARMVEAADA
ncbi:MAG TPA: aminoglycoside phosphotransferase family protein [Terracidiphilus sp.]|nr:aminoglycoside phosphotransferase family protein [Terracidiphilus sp.]